MELSERCIKTLEAEGYEFIDEQHHARGTILPVVTAATTTCLFVTEGSIILTYAGLVQSLTIGNQATIPPHTPYSIMVGKVGCQLVIGEMLAP